MSSPTADWEKVGDRYYRKIQLYTAVFDQDLELENYIVAGAPCGGAIGMWPAVPNLRLPTTPTFFMYCLHLNVQVSTIMSLPLMQSCWPV